MLISYKKGARIKNITAKKKKKTEDTHEFTLKNGAKAVTENI